MKVLSINIRATQGGAGRMGYDLHKRLQAIGCDVCLLYGYGSSIAVDSQVKGDPTVRMIGTRPAVLGNYVAHWLIGYELFTPHQGVLGEMLGWADVVHIHAAHHWYLRWSTLVGLIVRAGKPAVFTAHDWWLVSGRCGFVRDCTAWQRSCGECGNSRFQDLPSLFDRSQSVREARQRHLRVLEDQVVIVCPSQHLQRDHELVFPGLDIRFIPNAMDLEYEAAVAMVSAKERNGIVFCASDLDSPGKIDPCLVRALASRHGKAINLVGRGNHFRDTGATHHGEVRDRRQMAQIYARTRALVFTSQMDNAPLTIIEALVAGCYVVAYHSVAASEMLAMVGGRCVASPEEATAIIEAGLEATLYDGQTSEQVAAAARRAWSGRRLVRAYLEVYEQKTGGYRRGLRESR